MAVRCGVPVQCAVGHLCSSSGAGLYSVRGGPVPWGALVQPVWVQRPCMQREEGLIDNWGRGLEVERAMRQGTGSRSEAFTRICAMGCHIRPPPATHGLSTGGWHSRVFSFQSLMAHGTLLSDDDIRLLAARGTSLSHCPLSNFYFGDAWFR